MVGAGVPPARSRPGLYPGGPAAGCQALPGVAAEGGKVACQVWFRSELARGAHCVAQAVSPRIT
eukprot:6761542-Lingulodinium_polyedra.AAC.1